MTIINPFFVKTYIKGWEINFPSRERLGSVYKFCCVSMLVMYGFNVLMEEICV